MAARTSAGMGVVTTITILGVSSLALFITTIVFLSKFQAAQKDLEQIRVDNRAFVSDGERNRDDVRNLMAQASQQRESLVGYLMSAQNRAMELTTGSASDSISTFESKLDAVPEAPPTPLLTVIRNRDSKISDLERQVTVANSERVAALEDRQNEVEAGQERQRIHDQTIAAMEAQIETLSAEVETYRQGVQSATDNMDARVSRIQTDAQDERDDLNRRLQGA
ncbi:MAG: hypothetical protein ACF8LL_06245, partial [Phycisphaerales bacterium]